MSGFGDGALPMGLLFFAGLVFGLVRRKTGHRLARKQYPELATRLGLTYRPSPYQSGVGTLSGEYRGFSVIVDPDEQRRIRLRFEGSPKVDLRNYEKEGRPPHDMRMVFSRDKKFDAFFKTRWAGEAERARLEALERPGELLAPFRLVRELKELNVTAVGVSCVFDYGSPPFIPRDVIEHLLPAMVELARVFERPEERAFDADGGAPHDEGRAPHDGDTASRGTGPNDGANEASSSR